MASNLMDGLSWIDSACTSLLDVGCNVGELLAEAARRYPHLRLAGVDINPTAVAAAQRAVPQSEIRHYRGPALPFADDSFDQVTCIEVLEHIPAEMRRASIGEIRRVLRPGGRLVLRCPHRGTFQGLDANNLRFRFPRLYGALIGRGARDEGYAHHRDGVVWHEHFSKPQLLELAGAAFELEATRYGGWFLLPLGDLLAWPFYRRQLYRNPALRLIHRMMAWDLGIDYGEASFTILLVMRKRGAPAPGAHQA